jgi:hypothetical protein
MIVTYVDYLTATRIDVHQSTGVKTGQRPVPTPLQGYLMLLRRDALELGVQAGAEAVHDGDDGDR